MAADGALDGARGNSGAIFAQFLHGLAAAMEKRAAVDLREFAVAARRGAESAYSALSDPREGTILTVVRVWAHELGRRDDGDFIGSMHRAVQAAREALADTPRQLEVLARSHVVDAGGQGFVYFVEGLLESLRGGHEVAWVPSEAAPHGVPPFSDVHEAIDERFRYCSEALVVARDDEELSREALVAAVTGLGESLVVAGGGRRLRVHLHTNEPQLFLSTVTEYGAITQSKVDDMVLQQLAGREATIAVVVDSTTDLPETEAFKLGVVAVPLTLSIGEEEYLDGVDITLEAFVDRLVSTTGVPRSSQPAAADFEATYQRLLEYREGVVSIHIAGAMSGTVRSARSAAQQVDPERIRVIDSCSVSVGAGLLVRAVGEAIAGGATLDEVEELAERVKRDITIFGAVRSLDFAVRGAPR
jgi:dihydroxyacetone kinase-like predicted kinase